MTKAELRKVYRQKREALPLETYQAHNRSLTETFFRHFSLEEVKVLHAFIALPAQKEPDTWPIIHGVWQKYPEVKVVIPRIHTSLPVMECHPITNKEALALNRFGIAEPGPHVPPLPPEEVDMALLPLLAFDERGYRVGFGKGYYDRYLARCRKDMVKIGLSLEPPVEKITDIDQFDIPLDYAITPDGVYGFGE